MPALPTQRLDAVLPLILPYVKHCPEPYALFQLRMAAIEFCERTKCWRNIVTVDLTENHTAIVAPPYSTIHEFEEAWLGDARLTPTQFTNAEPDELFGRSGGNRAKFITQIAPGEVAVYPFEAGTLKVSVFLKPRQGQQFGTDAADPMFDAFNVIPAFLFDQNAMDLASGALARIMLTPDEPFSDPARAAFHDAAFKAACAGSFASSIKGQQNAPIRVKPNWM